MVYTAISTDDLHPQSSQGSKNLHSLDVSPSRALSSSRGAGPKLQSNRTPTLNHVGAIPFELHMHSDGQLNRSTSCPLLERSSVQDVGIATVRTHLQTLQSAALRKWMHRSAVRQGPVEDMQMVTDMA